MRKPFVKKAALLVAVLLLTCFVFGIGLCGCKKKGAPAADDGSAVERFKTTKVMHITDTHILPAEFCNEYSKVFDTFRHGAKLVAESEAATITAFGEMLKMTDPPDIVIVSGDLTSDGEVLAHKRLAEILTAVTDVMRARKNKNFQIFVTPGNHDLYNKHSKSFMPKDEDLKGAADKTEFLRKTKRRSVATATYKDFFEIYKDFGYAVVDKDGKPLNSDRYADGVRLKFFYDSDEWYDDKTGRELNEDGTVSYTGFDIFDPQDDAGMADFEKLGLTKKNFDEAMKDFEAANSDYNYLAKHSRAGIATFIAECPNGVTVIGADASNKDYSDAKRNNTAQRTSRGWHPSTGGLVTDAQMRWIIKETRQAHENDDLMLLTTHYNSMAHFPAQDEVISKFVLDNMERFSATMAKYGIRYTFTGHQHANDISNTISQAGDVMYDFETGSAISYGSAYRILDFTREWRKNGNYSERAVSNMYTLGCNDKNGTNDVNNDGGKYFYYTAYKAADDPLVAEGDKLTDSSIYHEFFDLFPHGDERGKDSDPDLGLISVRMYPEGKDSEGNAVPISIGKLMTDDFRDVLPNMLEPYVDGINGQLDKVKGLVKSSTPFLKEFLGRLVEGLKSFNLKPLEYDEKGSKLKEEAQSGYVLKSLLTDLEDYLMNFDFSYGTNPAKTVIPDIVIDVYGAHLGGAGGTEASDTIKPLIAHLEDGSFGRWLVDTVVDIVIPQLDLIFNAPIRVDWSSAVPAEGTGFDIAYAMEEVEPNGQIDTEVKKLLSKYGFKTLDENGNSSLKLMLTDLVGIAKKLVRGEEVPADLNKLKLVFGVAGMSDELSGIVDMVLDYIDKYIECGSLYEIVQTELMDKYITDAFLKNICAYAKYLIVGMDTDDTPDGSYWGEGDKSQDYIVKNYPDFNFATTKADDYVVDGVRYTYYRAKGTDGRIAMTPTEENGRLPAMINVFYGEDACRDKTIRWFTSIDQDIYDKTEDGRFAFLPEEFAKPESFIRYSTNEDLSKYTEVKAETVNFERERPGIDLGITYFTTGGHRYKFFNRHTVSLKDLKPGTTYYYRLGSDKYGWTETHTFATAGDGDFSFLAIADIQGSVEGNYTESLPSLRTALKFLRDNGRNISFIASMGDNVDYEKNYKQFEWWLTGQKEIWANHTMTTVAGNHDSAQILSNWLALPGRPDGESGRLYYSFDVGPAHMIVVDTNDIVTDKDTKGKRLSEKQTEWLVNELEASTKEGDGTPWTIVMLHKGLYTAGSHAFDIDVEGIRAQLTPIFYEYGVDVVLGGHDHTYVVSRFIDGEGKATEEKIQKGGLKDPSGVLYITLGTMGDKFYKYLYRDEVPVTQREITDERLKKYVTADGKLELTETPVFADVGVTGHTLGIKTYTIIDGEVVPLDEITLTKGVVPAAKKKLSGGAIAGIVIGSVGGTAVLIAVVIAILKKKRI